MPRSSCRLLLALTALLTVAGCQLDNINCQKGSTMCSDDKLLECRQNKDGVLDWILTDRNCTAITICQEGETKCIQGNIYTCPSEGKWPDKATTECGEAGCSEGTIQTASNPLTCFECGNDEAKCDGNDLVTCNNHQLSKTLCDNGCMQTESNAYCRECKDDELKCDKGFIVSCAKDGENSGKWDDAHKKHCEFGCFHGASGDENAVNCYECNTDKSRCLEGTIQSCLSNKWHDIDKCEFGCTDGADAKCHECLNDKPKYYNHADGYCVEQKCENNLYQSPELHEFSCNKDLTGVGECLNGNAKCEDNSFKFCLDGSWITFGNCDSENECSILNGKTCEAFSSVGQTCDNNKLKPCPNNASCKPDFSGCAECQNGTSKCENNTLRECKDGAYKETTCAAGTHCEIKEGKAQCVKHDCENGQQRCLDNIIQTCENSKWKTTAACANGEQCKVSEGVAACNCTSGTSYCDDKQAISCMAGQWQTMDCGIDKSCSVIAGKATCIECESGTKCQGETKIMTCQNNAWSAATSCADGMKCAGDTGSAKCVCTTGQAKCDLDNTKIIKCKADGTYGSAESCGADQHCEGVAGSAVCTANPMECSPGAKQCNGQNLETCSSKGKWEKTQTCEKGCANMACNVCEGDEKICENPQLKTCNNGQWKITMCSLGCYDNTQCNVCPKGYKECSGNKLRTCLGNKWEEEECEDKCITIDNYSATCNCIVGSVECIYSNNARVCNQSGEWESKNCPGGCTNNVCKECQADAEKCEDGNYFVCSANGEWIPDGCEYGCNEMTGGCYPECAPGSKKCDLNSSYTCESDGSWASPMPCINGCNQQTGECNQSIVCADGEKRCKNSYIMEYCLFNEWHNQRCGNSANSCDNNECTKCSPSCLPVLNGLKTSYYSIPCNGNTLDVLSYSECSDNQCKNCDH